MLKKFNTFQPLITIWQLLLIDLTLVAYLSRRDMWEFSEKLKFKKFHSFKLQNWYKTIIQLHCIAVQAETSQNEDKANQS